MSQIASIGIFTQMDDMRENGLPAISDPGRADPERIWDVDDTAQSLNTCPKLRVVKNGSAIIEHQAETDLIAHADIRKFKLTSGGFSDSRSYSGGSTIRAPSGLDDLGLRAYK